jgi:hypothetical protein
MTIALTLNQDSKIDLRWIYEQNYR